MSTDVELVNRVRRKMREDDITATSDDLSTAILDELNTAMTDVLESRIWAFDIRSTSIITQATTSSTNIGLTNGSSAYTATLSSTTNVTIDGNYTWRMRVSNASVHANTSFIVLTGVITDSAIIGTIDANWPDTTLSNSGTGDFFVSEYQFPQHSDDGPSQVRQLLSMVYQERPLDLLQVTKEDFNKYITRFHYSLGNEPRIVFTGFDVLESGNIGTGARDYAPGFAIWPVPDDAIRLDYTYVYSHPAITSSQALTNVPRSIEDKITELAYARLCQSGVINEPQVGVVLEQNTFSRLDDMHRGQKKDPLRRITVLPHNHRSMRDPANFGIIPTEVGSL